MKTDIPMMEFLLDTDQKNTVTFTPLKKVIFDKKNNGNGLEKGDKGLLVILLSAVIASLIFAVTNYINLTVANTGIRAREMATRRLLGHALKLIPKKIDVRQAASPVSLL